MNENDKRVERAQVAVEAYADVGSSLDEGITDLLCDLKHLCGRRELDFDELLRVAERHYDAEVQLFPPGREVRGVLG